MSVVTTLEWEVQSHIWVEEKKEQMDQLLFRCLQCIRAVKQILQFQTRDVAMILNAIRKSPYHEEDGIVNAVFLLSALGS